MSGEAIDESELLTLFEAARWAPSSGNSQPWRFLYARRDTEHWPVFLDLLVERNREWCVNAAALVVFVSRTVHEQTGRALITHAYDTGAAWMSLALQGWLKGLVVHGMAGFDYGRARDGAACARRVRRQRDGGRRPARPRRGPARVSARPRDPEPAAAAEREPVPREAFRRRDRSAVRAVRARSRSVSVHRDERIHGSRFAGRHTRLSETRNRN